ncbi:hypothetical protein HMPREF0080_02008 [Anaeroglobus geminatus F0357]|uniref:Uncharacterized protein n=1 Tax=Anaeroglobus geminatus F0357 TaxID=861450 RepID=G9YK01_9FIRM|nr:hypothetical protein HMPREF0080_02008 [Anaeroglobus geminatus F0357]
MERGHFCTRLQSQYTHHLSSDMRKKGHESHRTLSSRFMHTN